MKAQIPQRSGAFGAAVDVDEVMLAGAPAMSGCGRGVDPDSAAGCTFSGEAGLFDPTGAPVARLKPDDPGRSDAFGAAVATVGASVFVGAPREDGCPGEPLSNACPESGGVHFFRRELGQWVVGGRVAAGSTPTGARFGAAVATTETWLAVGAPGVDACDDPACAESGAVHLFRRDGLDWIEVTRVSDPDPRAGARFGAAVALSDELLVVGAPDDPRCGVEGSCSQAGAAHLFVPTSTSWRFAATLRPERASAFDQYGYSVAVDGDTVAIGAPGDAGCGRGVDPAPGDRSCSTTGGVEVWRGEGERWSRLSRIKSPHPDPGDRLGASVALAATTLAVGAPGEASCGRGEAADPTDDGCRHAGAVFVYRVGDETVGDPTLVKATLVRAGQRFGASLALDSGATSLVVGLPGDSSCSTDEPDGTGCFESGRVERLTLE